MDKRQTAIDWLVEQVFNDIDLKDSILKLAISQAKEMEKEQMDKVSEDWFVEGCIHIKDNKRIYQSFEDYYISTYGK